MQVRQYTTKNKADSKKKLQNSWLSKAKSSWKGLSVITGIKVNRGP